MKHLEAGGDFAVSVPSHPTDVLLLPFPLLALQVLLQDTARCSILEVAGICQREMNGGLSLRLG